MMKVMKIFQITWQVKSAHRIRLEKEINEINHFQINLKAFVHHPQYAKDQLR